MIQRLKSLKKFDIAFIISCLIALTAVLVFIGCTAKRNKYLFGLSELKQKSIYNDHMLDKQLADSGYVEEGVRSFLTTNGLIEDYSLKSMDEIIEILKEYPSDYETAIHREDIYSVGFGFPLFGVDEWERFIANSMLHRPGFIVMAQFSANFVGTYYYIEYDGTRFHIVEDRSRDFENRDAGYSEAYGKYLRLEAYPTEAGYAEYAFLTDDVSMTYKQAESYYLADDENAAKAPSFWSFYIGVCTDEIIANNMLTPDRISQTFKNEYTGFLDRHPDYAEDNSRMDYDGDGLLDRIYREHIVTEDGVETNNAYLLFGNGNYLVLGKDLVGDSVKTILADLDFDGDEDISFIDYCDKPGKECARLSVFENKSGHFVSVNLPRNEAKWIEMIIAESDGNNIFKFIRDDGTDTEYYVRWRDGGWKVQE